MNLRPMTSNDLDAGVRLCRMAKWNQRIDDWRLFLNANPAGCFVAAHDGQVVGTVTTIVYAGAVAWIAMVLVDPAMRRRGVGTGLLEKALDALADCPCVKLDATPAGREVYLRLDFVDEYPLSRMTAPAAPSIETPPPNVRAMTDADIGSVAAFDAAAFGVERRAVIEGFCAMAPEYALIAENQSGDIAGYALGRHGERFEHAGPVIAPDLATAQALAETAFSRVAARPVLIDVPRHSAGWLDWLHGLGFTEQRPFTRMYRGTNAHPGTLKRVFAISGPELG